MTQKSHNLLDLVIKYLNESKWTVTKLANKAGIGEATLRRLLQSESEPSLETVIALTSIVGTQQDTLAIIAERWPQYLECYKNVFNQNSDNKTSSSFSENEDAFNQSLQEPISCYIIHLASTTKGTTRQNINDRFGAFGISSLNSLIEKGIITEKNSQLTTLNLDFSLPNYSLAKKVLCNILNLVDESKPKAILNASEGVNEQGYNLLKETFIEFSTKVNKIKNNPMYKGQHTFFLSATINEL